MKNSVHNKIIHHRDYWIFWQCQSIVFAFVQGWKHSALALPKTNLLTVSHGPSCHQDRVAVLNELSLFTIGQIDIVPSSPSYLQQTAELFLFFTTDSSRTQHVASSHIASSNGVMSQLLGYWPVHVLEVGCANRVWFLEFWCLYGDVQVDVVWDVVFLLQVFERGWLLVWEWDLAAFKGFKSDDPWGNCWNSVFGSEGAQRNVFPSLEVSETPVIQQHKSKDMFPCLIDLDGLSQLIGASSQKCANFHFKVQSFTLAKAGLSSILCLNLSPWSVELGSTDNNRRRSTMVANGNLKPVLIERILRASNDRPDVKGMCTWRVKVSVVANLDWDVHVDVLDFVEQFAFEIGFVLEGGIGSENVLDGGTCFDPVFATEAHKGVETVLLEDFFL